MGFFKKLAQSAIDVVAVPVEIVKDTATLGGVLTEREESYTAERLRRLARNLGEAYDSLDDD